MVQEASNTQLPTGGAGHVLDNGAILHRIHWPRGSPTYRDIYSIVAAAHIGMFNSILSMPRYIMQYFHHSR